VQGAGPILIYSLITHAPAGCALLIFSRKSKQLTTKGQNRFRYNSCEAPTLASAIGTPCAFAR
jgi:hypothetical protein